jgi:peptide/nickel transport system substrate-binding protein
MHAFLVIDVTEAAIEAHPKRRNCMKATRFVRAIAATAVGALAIAGISAVAAPAGAATRSTVVIVESNALTSLNPSTPDTNLTINADVAYMTGAGFNYYNSSANLVKNTTFGSYKIIKNTPKDFRVVYTVNKGKLWSDGTAIDGVDLLLSHVLSSGAYSKKAGLGDPKDTEKTPAFNSLGYGGVYDSHVVGLPTLSADKMSVTVRYDSFQPDWEITGPGVNAVHALVQLANGKTKLGSAAENTAAKAAFLAAFKSYNNALLSKMAKVWSESYNIKSVNSSTNPLLLVGNGAYKITGAVADQSVTLGLNPKYNSGPKTNGIKTVILKMIADGTAASQALANKEIDIYQGQPTADAVAQLKAIPGVTVIGGTSSCFEHVDVRQGSINDTDYTGPFAASNNAAKNAKARDLRTAFLLAFPRQEIVDKLVKPINSKAVVVNSSFTLPGQTGYNDIVKGSGVSKFTAGTQATRTAAALALVKKHYPTAAADSKSVAVKLLWGQPSNTRRAAEAALIKAELAKAGFDVENTGTSGWGGFLDDNKYDAAFFAWCPTSTSQTGSNANFQSDGGNNFIGYNNPLMDSTLKSLEQKLSPAQITAKYLAAEKLLISDAVTLPIFQHPAATAVNSALKNVKPAPLSPTLVWNFWEWKY